MLVLIFLKWFSFLIGQGIIEMKNILFIVLISLTVCSAQTTSQLLPTEQFRKFHKLTVDDGLSQNLALFIHQDKQGFMWFGTAGGLDRFDGIEFKTFRNIKGLTKQPVYFYSCIENNDSTFWLTNDFGLMLFKPAENSAQLFIPSDSLFYSGGSNDLNNLTKINDSTLLINLTGKGLIRFDVVSKKFSLIYKLNSNSGRYTGDITGIIPFKNNFNIIVTLKEVLLYNDKTFEIKTIAIFPSGVQTNCTWFDKETGSILIGTSKGVFKFANNSITPIIFPFATGLKFENEIIRSIFRDSKGTLWVGMEKGLTAIIEEKKKILYYLNNPLDPSSILPGAVVKLFEDRSENLWISIQDRGICRIDLKKEKFSTITNHPGFLKQLANEIVSDIQIDFKDNLWVSGYGLNNINLLENKIRIFPKTDLFNARRIHLLTDSLLVILSSQPNGKKIYLYDSEKQKVKELIIKNIPTSKIYNLFIRRNSGNLLCVTRDSLFEVDPFRGDYLKTVFSFHEHPYIPSITIVDDIIEDDRGNLWIGTTYGLIYLNESQSAFRFISDTTKSTVILSSPTITTLAFSGKDFLWIGTTSGLYKYDIKKQTMKGFYVKDGLPNDKIWSIAVDKKQRVWATSNRGLIKLEELPSGKFNIHSYTIEDGLPSNEFSMAVAETDSKGRIYFGTPNGVVSFHPDSMQDNPNNSSIVLTDLKKYGNSVPDFFNLPYVDKIQIPYEEKIFSVRFASLDFTDASRIQYIYKLEGYENRWIMAGKRREAFFTNLDPGKYTLLIKSSNSDGVWNEKPLTVVIEIIPPFWMTWWFRGIVIIVVLLSIGGSIRYLELRKVKRQIEALEHQQAVEKERSRISKDMHDEIGANLTKISLLGNIASKGKQSSVLSQINETVNETIEKMDEIVWAINPSNDNLKNLTSYISEYAQNFFESSEIKCRFNLPEIIPGINLTSEKRHHLFLTIKEALNNVQKYSEANKVSISLLVEPSYFNFIIKDDGKGFCLEAVSATSNGITNMRERINSVGGEFGLCSKIGEGTEISIKVFRN